MICVGGLAFVVAAFAIGACIHKHTEEKRKKEPVVPLGEASPDQENPKDPKSARAAHTDPVQAKDVVPPLRINKLLEPNEPKKSKRRSISPAQQSLSDSRAQLNRTRANRSGSMPEVDLTKLEDGKVDMETVTIKDSKPVTLKINIVVPPDGTGSQNPNQRLS